MKVFIAKQNWQYSDGVLAVLATREAAEAYVQTYGSQHSEFFEMNVIETTEDAKAEASKS